MELILLSFNLFHFQVFGANQTLETLHGECLQIGVSSRYFSYRTISLLFQNSELGFNTFCLHTRELNRYQSFPTVWMQAELTGNCLPHFPGPSVGILPENPKDRTLWNK